MKGLLRLLEPYRPMTLAVVGLGFLWPFYQRAFFRVTLFYQLGDLAEPCFGLFLVAFLAGSLAMAALHDRAEGILAAHRPLVPAT